MSSHQRISIGDLVLEGRTKRQLSTDGDVWSLNLDQIESNTGKVLQKIMMPATELGPSTYAFEEGTVLYSKLRPYLNKVVVANCDGFATTELVPLKCDPKKVFPPYLAYYLRSTEFLNFANMVVAGAKMPRMVMTEFWRYEVPLPPLPEQRRIAAILDQADALRAKRREALAELDKLAQSIFVEMFGDPVTNPKGWPETTALGEVAAIVSGVTKGRKLDGKATREVPYLAVANVQDMRLNLGTVKRIEATEGEIERYSLQEGDLLLTEGGDPDKLGRGTLWHGELPECIHQNHVFRVRLTADNLTPYFLNWLIGSQRGKKYFLKSAKQTTGIASINMTQLRAFPLLAPPLALQREFENVVGILNGNRNQMNSALSAAEALFASLQHRAFRGEL